MRTLVALIAVGAALTAGAAPLPPEADPGRLVLTVDAPAVVFKNEPLEVRLFASNPGRKPVTFVMPTDGSDVGWRVANYAWSVGRTEEWDDSPALPGGRCKLANPWRACDVVEVPPGGRVEIRGWLRPAPVPVDTPGTYFVRARHDFNPERADRGGGPPAVMARIAAIPRRVVTSGPAAVTVLAADCPKDVREAFNRYGDVRRATFEAGERLHAVADADPTVTYQRMVEVQAASSTAEADYHAVRKAALARAAPPVP